MRIGRVSGSVSATSSDPGTAGPAAVSVSSSSSAATRRGQMILSGRDLSIQNDSGLGSCSQSNSSWC
jgi:hypothetical protein